VLPQQGLVDAGFVIKTFEVGLGHKLHEILIATFVLTQNDQMIRSAARGIAILVIGFRDVHLATNDGLYAGLGCRIVETDCTEKVAVVRDGDCRHSILRGRFSKHLVIDRTIKKAEA
jgi:hypothetical protein